MKKEPELEIEALQIAIDLTRASKKMCFINDRLIAEVQRLTQRELEAAELISSLLVEL